MLYTKFKLFVVRLLVYQICILHGHIILASKCLDIPLTFRSLKHRMNDHIIFNQGLQPNEGTIFLDFSDIKKLDTNECSNKGPHILGELGSIFHSILNTVRRNFLSEPKLIRNEEYYIHKISIDISRTKETIQLNMFYDNDKNNLTSKNLKYDASLEEYKRNTSKIFSFEIIFSEENPVGNMIINSYTRAPDSMQLPNKLILTGYERIINVELVLFQKPDSFFSSYFNIFALIVLISLVIVFSIIALIAKYQSDILRNIRKKGHMVFDLHIQSADNENDLNDEDSNYDIETTSPVLVFSESAENAEDNYDMIYFNQEAPPSNWLNQAQHEEADERVELIRNRVGEEVNSAERNDLGFVDSTSLDQNQIEADIHLKNEGVEYIDADKLTTGLDLQSNSSSIGSRKFENMQKDECRKVDSNLSSDDEVFKTVITTHALMSPKMETETNLCEENSDVSYEDEELLKEIDKGNFDRIKVVNSIYYLDDSPTNSMQALNEHITTDEQSCAESYLGQYNALKVVPHEYEQDQIEYVSNSISLKRTPKESKAILQNIDINFVKVDSDERSIEVEQGRKLEIENNFEDELAPPLPPRTTNLETVQQSKQNATDCKESTLNKNHILNRSITKISSGNEHICWKKYDISVNYDGVEEPAPPLPPRTDLLP